MAWPHVVEEMARRLRASGFQFNFMARTGMTERSQLARIGLPDCALEQSRQGFYVVPIGVVIVQEGPPAELLPCILGDVHLASPQLSNVARCRQRPPSNRRASDCSLLNLPRKTSCCHEVAVACSPRIRAW
jgi:hypothetical protein